ncbi:953_t:CDS:2, partial [Gigaspora rosea]
GKRLSSQSARIPESSLGQAPCCAPITNLLKVLGCFGPQEARSRPEFGLVESRASALL